MDPISSPVPFDKLKLGEVLVIVAAAVGLMKTSGIIASNGDFMNPTASVWAKYASDVVAVLKEQNVAVPQNVDKIIAAAPLVITAFGIK